MAQTRLTTTSYAILALLNLQPWTAYGLAQQMGRSMGYIWPRAVSAIYEEPKRLVALGLASSSKQSTGKRPSTMYRITARGRRALRTWLAQPSVPPQFESEALVRISFPEAGSKQDLLASLRQFAEQADTLQIRVLTQVQDYVAPGHGPFPDRLHIITLDAQFVHEHVAAMQRWARWAIREVERWPSMSPSDLSFAARHLRRLAALEVVPR